MCQFETEWTQDRLEENRMVNLVRRRVGAWRNKQYYPDFIARVSGGGSGGSARLQPDLNLIIEVTGESRKDKAAKVSTARTLWIPAVNNHGGFGRWAFVEVTDPWDAQRTIRGTITASRGAIA